MFFEITGSLSVLSNFSGNKSRISTIDHILPDITKDSINANDIRRPEHNLSVNSDHENYLPYKFVAKGQSDRNKSIAHRKKLRVNSITPVSVNSSVIGEPEYDIIRDDIGYTKLVGKMFCNSIRSNSSKYVSEVSKFRSPSDYESSKCLGSHKDELLSGRTLPPITLFKGTPKNHKINPVNTCTEGFFEHHNFMITPDYKQMGSVRSTQQINKAKIEQKIRNNLPSVANKKKEAKRKKRYEIFYIFKCTF